MRIRVLVYRSPDGDGNAGGDSGTGGEAVKVNNQGGASGGATYTPPSISVLDAAPPEYRGKEYLKNIKDIPSLFKEFDGLQTKIGQRPAVGAPGPNAKPEEVDAFYKGLTPKEAKEYQFPETEFSKKNPRDEKFVEGFKDVLLKSGISAYQAGKFLPHAEEFLSQYAAGMRDQNDVKFEEEVKSVFKDQLEPSMKAAKDLIAANVPKELLPRLEKMTNDDLLLMTVMAKNIHDKYIKEDTLHKPGGTGQAGNADALQTEAKTMMQSEAYKDFRHPQHDATVTKVSELYQQIAGLEKVVPK